MPQGKGGKRKRRGKKTAEAANPKNVVVSENKNEKYGKVISLNGNCRITVETPDKEKYMCHIPGAFRKRVWIKKDDIVLFQLRAFESNVSEQKGDVISKYFPDQVKVLVKRKEIPAAFVSANDDDEDDQGIKWNVDGDGDSEEDSDSLIVENDNNEDEDQPKKPPRNYVPAQTRTYEMPPSESSESDQDWEDALKNL